MLNLTAKVTNFSNTMYLKTKNYSFVKKMYRYKTVCKQTMTIYQDLKIFKVHQLVYNNSKWSGPNVPLVKNLFCYKIYISLKKYLLIIHLEVWKLHYLVLIFSLKCVNTINEQRNCNIIKINERFHLLTTYC